MQEATGTSLLPAAPTKLGGGSVSMDHQAMINCGVEDGGQSLERRSARLLGQYRVGTGGFRSAWDCGVASPNAFKRHFAGVYERRTYCTGVPVKRPIMKCAPLTEFLSQVDQILV